MDKPRVGDGTPGPGRPKGSQNRLQRSAKEAIEQAATDLGGAERLVSWAQEAPENERVFWGTIYPKLLPLNANVSGNWNISWPLPPTTLDK